jgi:hypothetical protein
MAGKTGLGFKSQSAMEYLTTYGWAIIIIAVVLTALFELGLFNPGSFVNTTCTFPANFGCITAVLYSTNSTLIINLQQSLPSSINITAYGCNAQGTVSNMIKPDTPSNQIELGIGQNLTFGMQCYNNYTLITTTPGQIFKGFVLVNYTTLSSGFIHTVIGTLVAKAV